MSEPSRVNAQLDLLLMKRVGLVEDGVVKGRLGHCDQGITKF